MKRNRFLITLLALLLALLTACGQPVTSGSGQAAEAPAGETEAAPQPGADTLALVTDTLKDAGFGFTTADKSESPLYEAQSASILDLSQESGDTSSVTVYCYDSPEEALRISQGFDPEDPSSFGLGNGDGTSTGMAVDYVAPITLYLYEDCIVLYCGEDETVQELLTQTLGDPFAGTLSYHMEAIPHANALPNQ